MATDTQRNWDTLEAEAKEEVETLFMEWQLEFFGNRLPLEVRNGLRIRLGLKPEATPEAAEAVQVAGAAEQAGDVPELAGQPQQAPGMGGLA
jgi:hypothetical protein